MRDCLHTPLDRPPGRPYSARMTLSRRIRTLLLQLAVLFGSLAVALMASELVARHKYPNLRYDAMRQSRPEDLFMQFDPRLGWVNIPDRQVRFRRIDFDTRVTINHDGWRGPEVPRPRTPGRYRILVLGDSYAFGHGVGDEEVSAQLLTRLLPGVEVVNMAVTGYSTDQEYLVLRDQGLSYHPDLVVLYLCPNDLLDNGREIAWGLYWKPCFVLDHDSLRLSRESLPHTIPLGIRFRRALYQHFVLYNVLAWHWSRASEGPHFGGMRLKNSGQSTAGGLSEAGRLTRRLLEEMGRISEASGAKFLLVIIPPWKEPQVLAGIPPDSAGSSLDLGPVFQAYQTAHPDSALGFRYDTHWNARGHRLVAEAIADRIRSEGWWPPAEGVKEPAGGPASRN